MSYDGNVTKHPTTVENGKFVEIVGDARFPAVSVTRIEYPESVSMSPISTVETYPKYAVLTHLVNASDINISLSSSSVDIGNVGIIDHSTGSTVYAKVTQTDTIGGVPVGAISVTSTNPTSAVIVTNTVAVSTAQTLPVSGGVTVLNPVSSVTVLNPVTSLSAIVLNTVAVSTAQTLPVSGSVTVLNPVSSVNVLNSVALKDINNNNVSVVPSTSALRVSVTNPITATVDTSVGFPVTFASSPNFDAFGRLRTSTPLTLFDSSHRYRDNNLWTSLTAVGGSYTFNANQGLVDLAVSNLSGSSVIRETTKVFAYQPGKSLLTLNTFVMAPSATNLVQRVGYYNQYNGIYVQLSGGQISLVERSLVNGLPVTETVVPVSAWNGDRLDGTGSSGITLNITKSQIFWMDIEWLGMGTVRTGFVIDGRFILCHSFHHANRITSTYITTASLPLRYEITNTGATDGSRVMKQVCSTVISEGGYELRGLQQAIGTSVASPKVLTLASTFYPIVTIRLKSTKLDAIVILTAISLLAVTNGAFYEWRVIASGTTAGGSGTWVDAGVDSAVEYKLDATGITGGRVLAGGYTQGSNQGTTSVDILKEALFKFQLERNGLTSTPYELTLVAATNNAGSPIYGSVDWEEVSR